MLQPLTESVGVLSKKVGVVSEKALREHANMLFGTSFSKSFLIKSLVDVVHLVSKAKFNRLEASNHKKTEAALKTLVTVAKKMTIPTVKLCLLNCQAKYKDNGESARHVGLGRLIGLCKQDDNQTDAKFIERLRLGLPTGKVVGEDGLDGIDGLDEEYMNCKGPGVMLLELSSHIEVASEATSEAD
eukprot:scaffold97141_cov40-Attheya_sp.AAC.1